MRTKHIKPKVKQVKEKIEKARKQFIAVHGATICFDGWDNVIHCSLMNVILVCPARDIFIGSIDKIGCKKAKGYIAKELKSYLKTVGSNNVIQICLDNASAMLGVLDELIALYLHMYK
jgi:hypothetical protein